MFLPVMRDGWYIVEISLENNQGKKCSDSVTQRLPSVAFLLLDLGFSLAFFYSCSFLRVVFHPAIVTVL